MNPNLTQSRRNAKKNRPANEARQCDCIVGLARRCRPKPQVRTRRLQCQKRKRNSPLHLGSLKNRTLASRQRTPQSTQHLFRKCQMTRQQEHRLHHLAADARRYPLASPHPARSEQSKICLSLSRHTRKARRRTCHAGAARRVGGRPESR